MTSDDIDKRFGEAVRRSEEEMIHRILLPNSQCLVTVDIRTLSSGTYTRNYTFIIGEADDIIDGIIISAYSDKAEDKKELTDGNNT